MSRVTKEQGQELVTAFTAMRDAVMKLPEDSPFLDSNSEEDFIKAFEDESQAKEMIKVMDEVEKYGRGKRA